MQHSSAILWDYRLFENGVDFLTRVQTYTHYLYLVNPSYPICLWIFGPPSLSHSFIQSSSHLIHSLIPSFSSPSSLPNRTGAHLSYVSFYCLGPAISSGDNLPERELPHRVSLSPVFSLSSHNSPTDDISWSIHTFKDPQHWKLFEFNSTFKWHCSGMVLAC